MNKVVLDHYPVEELPEDVRALFPNTATVTIEVAAEEADAGNDNDPTIVPLSTAEALALMRQMQRENGSHGISADEAVARIRGLRDEWDD